MIKEICCKTSEYYDFFIPPNRDDRIKRIRKMILSDTIFDCSNARIEEEKENSKTAPVYQKLARSAFFAYRHAAIGLPVLKFIYYVILTDKITNCVFNIPVNKNIKALDDLASTVSFIPLIPLLLVIPKSCFDHISTPLFEEILHRFVFQNILEKTQNKLKKAFPKLTNQRISSYICSPSFCTISCAAYFALSHLPKAKAATEQRFALSLSIYIFIFPVCSLHYQIFGNLTYPILTHLGVNSIASKIVRSKVLCTLTTLSYLTYLLMLIVLPYRKTENQQDRPA